MFAVCSDWSNPRLKEAIVLCLLIRLSLVDGGAAP